MELNILQLADVKQSFEGKVKQELLKMDCYFQDFLWDGYSDLTDPDFISSDDFDAIQALTDKMFHMIFNIGCPNSVLPMLESICTRKIKRWQGNNSIETDNHTTWVWDNERRKQKIVVQGFKKGKQLKTIDQVARVKKSKGYYNDAGIVLVGHFRWNNRGYLLSRRCTDLLQDYLHSLEY